MSAVENIISVRLRWQTQTLPDEKDTIWEALGELGSIEDIHAYVGPFWRDEGDPRVVNLTVCHRHEGVLSWYLDVRRRPSSDPPSAVVEAKERAGGGDRLLQVMRLGFPPQGAPLGTYIVDAFLPGSRWRPVVALPSGLPAAHEAVQRLGKQPRVEQVGYRFPSGGVLGVEEVVLIYLHDPPTFSLQIRASHSVDFFGERWLPHADSIVELVTENLFENKPRDGLVEGV